MKRLLFILCAGILCLLYACNNNDLITETYTITVNEPVLMSAKAFRESVKLSTTEQKISNYGKICYYNGFLYISETEKGIHIVDNRNPSDPQIVGFIELLGNADLAVRDRMLYADSYIDLVWFNIDNPAQPELKGRLENVFPYAVPLTNNIYGYGYNDDNSIIVGWEVKEKTITRTFRKDEFTCFDNVLSGSNSGAGVNGSMSRFVVYQDHLYTVANNHMDIFSLSGVKPEIKVEHFYIGYNVETIFSNKNNLFMGTPTGMLIFSVADPLKPEFQSLISHTYGCDPVVVENDIAYVTIHSSNMCGQNTNELLIYDVSDVKTPRHIVSYAMTKPKGLGMDKGTLFLCDDGLKIFNASDPQSLMANRLAHYSGMDGFDVIPVGGVLMMIAADGLYQYDYSDLQGIKQISVLPAGKQ